MRLARRGEKLCFACHGELLAPEGEGLLGLAAEGALEKAALLARAPNTPRSIRLIQDTGRVRVPLVEGLAIDAAPLPNELEPQQMLELALVENVQRADLDTDAAELGQLRREVERLTSLPVLRLNHAGGHMPVPNDILELIRS